MNEKRRHSRMPFQLSKNSVTESPIKDKDNNKYMQLEDKVKIEIKELMWVKNLTENAKFYKYCDSKTNPKNKFVIRPKKAYPERYNKPAKVHEEN